MPSLKSDKLGLMIDTGGCPNRCAHCFLSGKPTRRMSYEEMSWIVQQFRELQDNGHSLFTQIEVGLWLMEPDFRDDYRELRDLERELTDVFPQFGELEPWYCLGNLRKNGAAQIIENYITDQTPGQNARFVIGPRTLTEKYGDPKGKLLYSSVHLLQRWIHQHCDVDS